MNYVKSTASSNNLQKKTAPVFNDDFIPTHNFTHNKLKTQHWQQQQITTEWKRLYKIYEVDLCIVFIIAELNQP